MYKISVIQVKQVLAELIKATDSCGGDHKVTGWMAQAFAEGKTEAEQRDLALFLVEELDKGPQT